MEAPKSWSQFRGLPGAVALWGKKASYKARSKSQNRWIEGDTWTLAQQLSEREHGCEKGVPGFPGTPTIN
jgi:hypothetical protein